jgi:hypothetical protein
MSEVEYSGIHNDIKETFNFEEMNEDIDDVAKILKHYNKIRDYVRI